MADEVRGEPNVGMSSVSEAFRAARDLLAWAQADADRVRADADRYVRQRESEAELLVAKARRVLEAAEAQVTAIRVGAREVPAASPPDPSEPDVVIDLDALAGGGRASPARVSPARHARRPLVDAPTSAGDGFDGILATAITRAVDRALEPTD